MRIKFTQDHKVEDREGKRYHKDEVHELSDDSAYHFINRGVAVEAPEEKERRRQSTLVRKDAAEDEAKEPEAAEAETDSGKTEAAKRGGRKAPDAPRTRAEPETESGPKPAPASAPLPPLGPPDKGKPPAGK